MKVRKTICTIFMTSFILMTDKSMVQAGNERQRDPNVTTKSGRKLSEAEVKAIERLSIPGLVETAKKDDAMLAAYAIHRLEVNEGWKQNFDLLLDIAAEKHGDMIVEWLLSPDRVSANDEDKCRVDKFLSFLEEQLKKEKPSVSRVQAVRSMAQSVKVPFPVDIAIKKSRDPNADPNQLTIPYANQRVVNTLMQCLNSEDSGIRREAIMRLGDVGANDLSIAYKVKAALEAQRSKEENMTGDHERKKEMARVIQMSLERLNHTIALKTRGLPRGPVTGPHRNAANDANSM